MISKWAVSNFKSIRKEAALKLSPLTIFAGANSSGKSAFIQSILLVAQTLASKISSRPLILNGHLTNLGQFDALKSNGSLSNKIAFKCIWERLSDQDPPEDDFSESSPKYYFKQIYYELQKFAFNLAFEAEPPSARRKLRPIQPRLSAVRFSCLNRNFQGSQRADISVLLAPKDVAEIFGAEFAAEMSEDLRDSLTYAVKLDNASLAELRDLHGATDPCGCLFRHFFPSAIVCAVNAIEENVKAISHALRFWSLTGVPVQNDALPEIVLSKEMIAALRNILGMKKKFDLTPKVQEPQNSLSSSEPISFRRWYENLLRLPVDELGQIKQAVNSCGNLSDHLYAALKSAAQKFKPRAFVKKGLPILLSDAFRQAEDVFVGSLKYLCPLRAAPRPPYLLATDVDLDDAGIGGEHAAVIFELHKKKPVKYIPSAHFQDHSIDPKPIASTLEAAATDWLERLGLASSVKCRAQGKWGHELKVTLSPSDAPHDLRQAGSGVSQVLPIIVMGLLADSDSTLIFEHPELHLHPKVQTLLGDFFLSMALCGKQCLVETHSEYLIDRLRFRIAAASPENELHSLAKIYFAEKAPQGSTFREVVINEYGAITDWPEGFFDESQEQAEKILMAATRKRKAERKNKEA